MPSEALAKEGGRGRRSERKAMKSPRRRSHNRSIIVGAMNVLGMQASSCRVVGEVANDKFLEAAGCEVQGSGVRAAPVRARSRRCRSHSFDRYRLAHDCGELLADRSLDCLGYHTDQV